MLGELPARLACWCGRSIRRRHLLAEHLRGIRDDPPILTGSMTAVAHHVGGGISSEDLRDWHERCSRELQLVTITGEPGIGKTRLVAEFEAALGQLDERVPRLRGRCLAYGDGIGFWPLAEAVKQSLGIDESDSEDEARARLTAG